MSIMRIITADWVFPPGTEPMREGALLYKGPTLIDLGTREALTAAVPGAQVHHLEKSALLPGLVNCHTHLELAGVDRIPAGQGFTHWVRALLEKKAEISEEQALLAADRGITAAFLAGTAYMVDIASTGLTALALMKAGMPGTVFHEFLGVTDEAHETFKRKSALFDLDGRDGIRILPACHAPFSTSKEIFRSVAAWAREHDCPLSMHLAESRDEVELLSGDSTEGALYAFLKERGFPEDRIPRPGMRPVRYLDELGILGKRTLAVHLVETEDHELDLLKKRGVTPCLCPSSNRHLLGRLPPVKAMLDKGLSPCLGTDSPASGQSLNLFGEMEILLDAGVDAADVLAMATLNGARALGLPAGVGRIEEGTNPALLCLPHDPQSDEPPLEAAIRKGAKGWVSWILTPQQNWVLKPADPPEALESSP
jgi:5-methylthioadenosine/S-adenosylhomocysteine deaminase